MRREWGSGSSPRPMAPSRCPACYGAGRSATRGCGRCRGEGRVRMLRSVRVRVPAGVADGQILRIKGQGDAGRLGGEAGDLFVKLQVYDLSAAGIERVGDDLHSTLSVGLIDALLGGEVPVATVRGRATISVPPGERAAGRARARAGRGRGRLLRARGAPACSTRASSRPHALARRGATPRGAAPVG